MVWVVVCRLVRGSGSGGGVVMREREREIYIDLHRYAYHKEKEREIAFILEYSFHFNTGKQGDIYRFLLNERRK